MIRLFIALLTFTAVAVAADSRPSIPYFTHLGEVRVSAPTQQNYVVITPDVWQHARPSLADLRLFAASDREVPYHLVIQGESSGPVRVPLTPLNLGRIGNATTFTVNTGDSLQPFHGLELTVRTRDFIGTAVVEGSENPNGPWTELARATIFDLSRERLGRNLSIRLPPSNLRHMRVTLPGAIYTEDLENVELLRGSGREARWTAIPLRWERREEGKQTVFEAASDSAAPIERIVVLVERDEQNFSRRVEVRSADGSSSGSLERIDLTRQGRRLQRESLTLGASGLRKRMKVVIHNGDDPPLRIAGVRAESLERRLYFDPRGESSLKLYFGDRELRAPDYDYARLFSEADDAVRAELFSAAANPAFTGRPDTRPWTERHPWILWTAIIVAVAALGGLALRSMLRSPGTGGFSP